MATQLVRFKRYGIALMAMSMCALAFAAESPSTPSPDAKQWRMEAADGSLRNVMQRWSQAAGWQLVWELPVDFAIEARAEVSGDFEDAVARVVKSMENSDMPMKAVFYRGNKVLRVTPKGAQ